MWVTPFKLASEISSECLRVIKGASTLARYIIKHVKEEKEIEEISDIKPKI